MPTLNLTSEDRDYFTRAAEAAREWHNRVVRPTETRDTEREIAEQTGDPDRLTRRGFERAANAMRDFSDAAAAASSAYNFIPRSWAAEMFDQRARDWGAADAGPFTTFAFDWIHGRVPQNPRLREVPWVNREYNARTRQCRIDFHDGSFFELREVRVLNDTRHGVFLNGPLQGRVVSERDMEWMTSSIRDRGYAGDVFHFRTPMDTASLISRRLDDYVERPTFSEATYTATIYTMPGDLNVSGRAGDRPFLVLRA